MKILDIASARVVWLCLALAGCNSPLVKSDCSQLGIKGTWSIKVTSSTPSACPLPSPMAITLPVPGDTMCAPGCTCSESHSASSRDVDKPLICSGQFTLTCGAITPLVCQFELDNNTSGGGSCTAGSCSYSLDTFARQ